MIKSQPNASSLIFVAFNRRVAALHRDTGAVIWSWKSPRGSGFPAMLLEPDRLVVSVNGYVYCLDPQTGRERWSNSMKGHGWGVANLASYNAVSPGAGAGQAEIDAQIAAAAAAA